MFFILALDEILHPGEDTKKLFQQFVEF